MSPVDRLLERLELAKKSGKGWTARCPAHEDRHASLSVHEGDDGRVLVKCFAGCSAENIVAALGLELRDLFSEGEGRAYTPSSTRATVQHSASERGCTLADYASAKGLPVPFLESLGVAEMGYLSAPAVRFPYLDATGQEICVRFRVSLDGDAKVRTKAGNKHCLYGLNKLDKAIQAGYAILVEGESDTQTLWHAAYPAIGIPGANGWNESRDAPHLADIPVLYVVVEPDKGGEAVLRWLGTSSIRARARLVVLDGAKDVSELYLGHRADFGPRLEQALRAAVPWEEHERISAGIRSTAAWEKCKDLAGETRILDAFAVDLTASGLAGEERAGKLLYLIFTSRFLKKPVSASVKGPSAGGKSFMVETVSGFFPPEASYALTAMSEHALAYGTEPLAHRHLILYEAAGLESDFASYIVRSLLSEGRVRYETVEKTSEGLQPRLIEREGPTGLITTTTKISLHPENETRLLSIPITDTPEQTRDVLLALAEDESKPPDLGRWIALQEWLAEADHDVAIPFARELAELVPPIAVRLRRDFGAILNLIRAHALLHQASRERDARGWIVARLEDYEVVRGLVVDLVSEGVEATVSATVRATVRAVVEAESEGSMSITELARVLKVDKSVASRRWNQAKAGGYLKNLEDKRGKPACIVAADPLPEDVQVLPTVEQLRHRCTVAGVTEGVTAPPSPHVSDKPEADIHGTVVLGWDDLDEVEREEVAYYEERVPDVLHGHAAKQGCPRCSSTAFGVDEDGDHLCAGCGHSLDAPRTLEDIEAEDEARNEAARLAGELEDQLLLDEGSDAA
jgi:hypothetical protein